MASIHDGNAVKPSKNEAIYALAIIGENVAVLNQQMETIHSSVCPDATDEENVSETDEQDCQSEHIWIG